MCSWQTLLRCFPRGLKPSCTLLDSPFSFYTLPPIERRPNTIHSLRFSTVFFTTTPFLIYVLFHWLHPTNHLRVDWARAGWATVSVHSSKA